MEEKEDEVSLNIYLTDLIVSNCEEEITENIEEIGKFIKTVIKY